MHVLAPAAGMTSFILPRFDSPQAVASKREGKPHAFIQELHMFGGQMADSLRQRRAVDGKELRNVNDRVAREAGLLGWNQEVARCTSAFESRSEDSDDHCADGAAVEEV